MREFKSAWASGRLWVSLAAIASTIAFVCLVAVGMAPAAGTSVRYISNTATGGDCTSIGTWDQYTKTCTLTTDLTVSGSNGVEINSDGITLDGGGHSLTSTGGFSSGGAVIAKTGITIKNLTINQFNNGVYIMATSNATITGNTLQNNNNGIVMINTSGTRIYRNNFIDNVKQTAITGGSGNMFSLPGMGGNFWSNYNRPSQGCDDNNGDFFCDAAFSFAGGQDAQAWTAQDGWNAPHPEDTVPPEVTGVEPSGVIGDSSATVTVHYQDPGSNINLAAVYVYLDGTALDGCTATQTNVDCPVTSLALGAHSVTGSVSDNRGNTSPISGSFTFTDDGAPVVSNIQPSGILNTGTVSVEAVYSDGSGSGVDIATLAVYLDGARMAGCATSASVVSCPAGGLADGNHTIDVSVDDVAGNHGSGNGSFLVDQTDPVVGTVTPSGAVSSSSVTITADYSDSGSGIDALTASLTLDGGSLTGCSATGTAISCPASGLATGAHTIEGTVSDLAGNSSPIGGAFEFVDNAAPSVTNILPTGTITSTMTTLSASFSDGSGSGIDGATVSVYLDGATATGCTATTFNVNCPVSGLANGVHAIAVTVDDNAGNHGSGSGSFTVDTSVPAISPTRYIRNNATGGDCTAIGAWDQYTKTCTMNTDLNFTGNGIQIVDSGITLDGNGHTITGSDAFTSGGSMSAKTGVTIKNLKIVNFCYGVYLSASSGNNIYRNNISGNKYGVYMINSASNTVYNNDFVDNTQQVVISGGSGNVFSKPLPAGGNYWSNYDTPGEGCEDAGGDGFCDAALIFAGGRDDFPYKSAQNGAGPLPVDTQAPTISGIAPAGWVTSSSINVYADYADADSGINTASVVVAVDGTALDGCSTAAGSVYCSASGLGEGLHTIDVSVADMAGNTGTGSGLFQVDTQAPSVTVITPSGYVNDRVSEGIDVDIAASYADANSGIDINSVTVRMHGQYVTDWHLTGCEAAATSTDTQCTVRLPAGVGIDWEGAVENITVSVTDVAGNTGSSSESFMIDSWGPWVTGIGPSGTINTTTTTVYAHYGDAESGIDTASVKVYLDGEAITGCTVTDGTASCPVAGLAEGTHSTTLRVSDLAGNENLSGAGSFTVDIAIKPELRLNRTQVFWASYADYQAGHLSVRYAIVNAGAGSAGNVNVTGSTNTAGVTMDTALPLTVGDIAAGQSAQFICVYNIPGGVTRWTAGLTATATDGGVTYSYP